MSLECRLCGDPLYPDWEYCGKCGAPGEGSIPKAKAEPKPEPASLSVASTANDLDPVLLPEGAKPKVSAGVSKPPKKSLGVRRPTPPPIASKKSAAVPSPTKPTRPVPLPAPRSVPTPPGPAVTGTQRKFSLLIPMAVGLGLIIVGVAGGVWYWNRPAGQLQPTEAHVVTPENLPAASEIASAVTTAKGQEKNKADADRPRLPRRTKPASTPRPSKKPVANSNAKQIAKLTNLAAEAYSKGNYTEPLKTSAITHSKQVLALDATNKKAKSIAVRFRVFHLHSKKAPAKMGPYCLGELSVAAARLKFTAESASDAQLHNLDIACFEVRKIKKNRRVAARYRGFHVRTSLANFNFVPEDPSVVMVPGLVSACAK